MDTNEVTGQDQLTRVPLDVHRRMKAAAALRGINLRELLGQALEEWLERHETQRQDSTEKAS